MNKRVESWLNYLNEFQPGFKVQRFIEYPCNWIAYDSADFKSYVETYGDPNHREILNDEIVIDVDAENTKHAVIHADMVEKKLKEQGYTFLRYISGGDGQHFHLIFPELTHLFTHQSLDDAKYAMIEYMLQGIINPENLDSHICLFKKRLIQIEGVEHRKGGTKKKISGKGKTNEINPDFFYYFEKKMIKKKEIYNKWSTIPQPNNLDCITYLEGTPVNGLEYYDLKRVNYRALFSLSAYYTSMYKDKKIVLDKVMTWYNALPAIMKNNSPITKRLINTTVKSNNGSAGCLYRMGLFEELGIDNTLCKNCPFYFEEEEK